jgi:hypothetical protein
MYYGFLLTRESSKTIITLVKKYDTNDFGVVKNDLVNEVIKLGPGWFGEVFNICEDSYLFRVNELKELENEVG